MPKKYKKDKNLPVLLLEDIPQIGNTGEIKKIRRGFAAFLLKNKKIIVINKKNLSKIEKLKLTAAQKKEFNLNKINEIKELIEKLTFETYLKIGPNKEIYNSINKNDIINFLKQNNIKIKSSQVELEKNIKSLGEYNISLNLGYGIQANLKVIVKEQKINN
jgi:large subunit ribosomal protein L9